MSLFEHLQDDDYEQLIFCQDRDSGLRAIICIHNTTLGPALGGCRMWSYATEQDAIVDVLRLARGMTYKAAVAGLNFGGGKAVILGDPNKDKSEALFRAFGRYVQGLNGRYITAEDVGTSEEDMDIIQQETDYVTGVSPEFGGGGNPAPVTAYGVYMGMKATAKQAWGDDALEGKTIAVQGMGNVAFNLCRYLYEEGARLIVTDIHKPSVKRAVEKFGAKAVEADDIYEVDCDIFSPNALGGVLNDETIPKLKARAIAGAANNVLQEARHGEKLHEMGFFYAPDYVINAGGVIHVADELQGYNRDRVLKKVKGIYHNIEQVFEISKRKNIPTSLAADRLAEERINTIQNIGSTFLLHPKHRLKEKN